MPLPPGMTKADEKKMKSAIMHNPKYKGYSAKRKKSIHYGHLANLRKKKEASKHGMPKASDIVGARARMKRRRKTKHDAVLTS